MQGYHTVKNNISISQCFDPSEYIGIALLLILILIGLLSINFLITDKAFLSKSASYDDHLKDSRYKASNIIKKNLIIMFSKKRKDTFNFNLGSLKRVKFSNLGFQDGISVSNYGSKFVFLQVNAGGREMEILWECTPQNMSGLVTPKMGIVR